MGFFKSNYQCEPDDLMLVQRLVPTYILGALLVGSVTARSYSSQDYWLTTVVTEIIEERKNEAGYLEFVRFKTSNSEYILTNR